MAQESSVPQHLAGLEPGFDLPALPGMSLSEVQTPALILDLDALARNLRRMSTFVATHGMKLRVHGKMHRSVDVYRLQEQIGGASGICCQKVSEAEVFARAGVKDILISNEVRDPRMIDRLAQLPRFGGRVAVCVDAPGAVADLAQAVARHGYPLDVLVEYDSGAGRCGVQGADAAVALAQAITAAEGLRYAGLQSYQGSVQHLTEFNSRRAAAAEAILRTAEVIDALKAAGLPPETVTGAGTGSYTFETSSGIYTELQCGSYAFMDADYGRVLDIEGRRFDEGLWENALFVLTQVISTAKPGQAVTDAGLKSLTMESGLPLVFGRPGLTCTGVSDEHSQIRDPEGVLRIGERLRLVPGHCDPTCNLHDWYVGLRGDQVEVLWPVSARGRSY
ncbi:DSD1 family PLP-dependent enzyme [Falsigemmobacter faecalis]|uniref:DSD1 family PLP-dependent enzyme n=1 Tax=Falsigemmobacter faecalis TaxID=2488730 RepID=A0A3P3DP98_9RHOB|nr:DSD1 family PLP-dependent enzyme [Falsigemmobacter faecalis]RRH75516.1 DSD1 family PLP-dependent enzyme [Falsigemmobacter faecalis]